MVRPCNMATNHVSLQSRKSQTPRESQTGSDLPAIPHFAGPQTCNSPLSRPTTGCFSLKESSSHESMMVDNSQRPQPLQYISDSNFLNHPCSSERVCHSCLIFARLKPSRRYVNVTWKV
ncbi:hypothetical protein GJ744_001652 [Endocarpon pusillum]|uniref:Uncharacterized protein n=1 Tax=Endocarpon pusillum TaxID=364733 RepID=A0A8H7ABB3_9EURO|nr:hypothetical protein GJ744_001652 [Endocarpon pusillum]